MRLSEHFTLGEFDCKGRAKGICDCTTPTIPNELLEVLEDVREHFGKPVRVYSGYRCEDYNRYVGGAKRSKHKLGIASDIAVDTIKPSHVQSYVLNKYKDKYGIGKYVNFTHIDIRSTKARW